MDLDRAPEVVADGRGAVRGDCAVEKLRIGAVPHGFRSSFRDWASERTDHPRQVAGAALAHVARNQTGSRVCEERPVRPAPSDWWTTVCSTSPDAEVLQAPKEALLDAVGVAVRQVSAAEIVVVGLVAEHEVSSGQHGGGDREDGLPRAAPALEAPELSLQIAPVLPGRRPRGLDQRRLKPRGRVTMPGRAALARTLVEARAQARPRNQMARTGKLRHVHAGPRR